MTCGLPCAGMMMQLPHRTHPSSMFNSALLGQERAMGSLENGDGSMGLHLLLVGFVPCKQSCIRTVHT